MKKLLTLLLVLGSFSIFAAESAATGEKDGECPKVNLDNRDTSPTTAIPSSSEVPATPGGTTSDQQ
ncbi:hypothetical protein ABMA70_10230 [Halobacteriovorax sp. XZX-3]|uniref:hypothetical protein n=1 Tax=unclassified Halobacteriovorax TaxID=2639665 RepID=UPI000CD15B3B|nr:hypothetical protein [Halobacteriovorax sp. DA5]POB13035.1 hypothetical protein C0Z22_10975 [Halobacteriovorax sp. DA5]